MGLRQISCSLQNSTGLIRAIRDIRVRLSLQQQRPRSLIRVIRDITSRWSVGLRQISCSFKSTATETSVSYSCHSRYSCSLNHSSNRDNRPYSCNSPYYFSLTSGSSTNLVFVSLTRTFRLSLFALHSQTSLPVPTSPPSCISTARCPPQPRYSHQDHLSQPTYP